MGRPPPPPPPSPPPPLPRGRSLHNLMYTLSSGAQPRRCRGLQRRLAGRRRGPTRLQCDTLRPALHMFLRSCGLVGFFHQAAKRRAREGQFGAERGGGGRLQSRTSEALSAPSVRIATPASQRGLLLSRFRPNPGINGARTYILLLPFHKQTALMDLGASSNADSTVLLAASG